MEKDLQKQVNELEWELDKLHIAYDYLERDRNRLKSKLADAQFRIDHELTPLLDKQKESYDSYVQNGGSDLCMRNGLCGPTCMAYEKEGCER